MVLRCSRVPLAAGTKGITAILPAGAGFISLETAGPASTYTLSFSAEQAPLTVASAAPSSGGPVPCDDHGHWILPGAWRNDRSLRRSRRQGARHNADPNPGTGAGARHQWSSSDCFRRSFPCRPAVCDGSIGTRSWIPGTIESRSDTAGPRDGRNVRRHSIGGRGRRTREPDADRRGGGGPWRQRRRVLSRHQSLRPDVSCQP